MCHHLRSTDPRTKDLFLLTSPWPIVAIITAYLYFVNGNGQKWMEKRKAYDLTKVINFYNLTQIVANGFVFLMVCNLCKLIGKGEIHVNVLSSNRHATTRSVKTTFVCSASLSHDTISLLLRRRFFTLPTCFSC